MSRHTDLDFKELNHSQVLNPDFFSDSKKTPVFY